MNLPVVSAEDETASLSTGWRTVVSVIVGTCADMLVTAQLIHTLYDVSERTQCPYHLHAVSTVNYLQAASTHSLHENNCNGVATSLKRRVRKLFTRGGQDRACEPHGATRGS